MLHAMLRHLAPRRVIEVGSGYSSALMLDTAEQHQLGTRFTFIDPEPERARGLLRSDDLASVITGTVKEIPLETFTELEPGDVLFIDSSHISRAGSDVNWLYFEVLSRLAPGVFVHVHDVFWPFDYPAAYLERKWAWNEAYLLWAMLTFSDGLEIVLFPGFLEERHAGELAQASPGAMERPPNWPTLRGMSIWLRRT